MAGEGTTIGEYTLKRLVTDGATGALYEGTAGDGSKWLVKVAPHTWKQKSLSGSIGVVIKPGRFLLWKPSPAELLDREFDFLSQGPYAGLMSPVSKGEFDEGKFAVFRPFDGDTVEALVAKNKQIHPDILALACRAIANLNKSGVWHGNISAGNLLVSDSDVLFVNSMMHTWHRDTTSGAISTFITEPSYYPLLDPAQDQLAMGLLLYSVLTGTASAQAKQKDNGRLVICGPQLSSLIDTARERGANRFLPIFRAFREAREIRPELSAERNEVIMRTLGLILTAGPDGTSIIELSDDSCLRGDRTKLEREQGIWSLEDAATALVNLKDKPALPSSKEQTVEKFKDAQKEAFKKYGIGL
ncbi:MAG TPA: hypothetical protein V6D17_15150 [Candidatus Obscuribacterales bacterium]